MQLQHLLANLYNGTSPSYKANHSGKSPAVTLVSRELSFYKHVNMIISHLKAYLMYLLTTGAYNLNKGRMHPLWVFSSITTLHQPNVQQSKTGTVTWF